MNAAPRPPMTEPTALSVPPDCLLVFFDETGHERLPTGHTVYGVGGCAVMMRDYERLVAKPWRDFRQEVTGNPNAALHAYEFGKKAKAKPEHLGAFGRVFRQNAFMRLGAAAAVTTKMPKDTGYKQHMTSVREQEHLAWMVLRGLANRVVDVARWTDFMSLAFIFEANPRSKKLRKAAFGDLQLQADGVNLPFDLYEMPKRANEPGLEVADFVANTVWGHARASLVEGRTTFRQDFQAVFQGVDSKLASYMGLTSVEWTPSSEQVPPTQAAP
jgi:hypothetical protein